MPDIWMDVDIAVTVPVSTMPLVDKTDAVTIEDAIVYNESGMATVWNFVTTAGVMTTTAITLTSGGVYDWIEEGTNKGMYSMEIPASGGGSANNDTVGTGWVSGETDTCVPFRGPFIGFRAAALNNALIDGGDTLDVNVLTVADQSQTANDNGLDINAIKVVTDAQTAISPASLVDLVWDEILTAGHTTNNSAGKILRLLRDSGGYLGKIWINTVDGTAGTSEDDNGTWKLPVDTLTDANTIAAGIGGVHTFTFSPDSSWTLIASQENSLLEGHGWTLALGSQSIASTHVFNAMVSGVATASSECEFHNCEFSTTSIQTAHFYECSFANTLTMTLAADYNYVDCYSEVAGAGAPIFTKTAGQQITAQFRRWSGGITISGLQSGDVVTISGELGTVTLNGADATVEIRGTAKSVVNNLTGSPTVNVDGVLIGKELTDTKTDTTAILIDTGTTLDTVVDSILALLDNSRGEPGQGAPPVNPDMATKIDYLYKAWRNKATQSSTLYALYDNAGSTIDQKATVSDSGSLVTKDEIGTGP